jgi:hypothetical protein
MKSVLLLFAAVLLSGCATAHLYPVQGPLSTQTPPPIYRFSIDGGETMSAKLAKGELCPGTWLGIPEDDPTAREMSAEWDLVYGKGFFLANVLGKAGIGRGTLTCPSGTKVKVEFNSVQGVAKDDQGNVFKLTF